MLQAQCVEWFKLQYPDKVIIAIPNGGFRNKIEAAKLKRCGVLPGVPDLFIAEPRSYVAGYAPMFPGDANLSPINMMRYPGFYIEMKIKGNKLTATQKDVLKKLSKNGYHCAVCYTFDEFVGVVREYFGG